MKKILYITSCLLLLPTPTALADDTEIYGTDGVDEDGRVNANVMFIMDTSGSMDGEVTIADNPYTPGTTYDRNGDSSNTLYDGNKFYHDLFSAAYEGHQGSTLTSSRSEGCESHITNLANEGRSEGRFNQYYNGYGWWRPSDYYGDDNDPITCDQGNRLWLYSGNYMNWYHNYQSSQTSTRLQVVVNVVKDLTESLSNVNLGLMRFDSTSADGGMVDIPVTDIATSGPNIRTTLDTYDHSGATPLSEVLYEAALYFRGETWEFGDNSSPNVSVPESRLTNPSSQYKTPIEASCQKNHVILLTDGEPTNDTKADDKIENLISGLDLPTGLNKNCSADSSNGGCLDELAYWMQNSDHNDNFSQSQNITVHTIGGFDLTDGVALLENTAKWGGGGYHAADNTQELTLALDQIFLKILAADTTFTAPAVSVNAFNTSEHRDDLFYALFRPADNIKWAGNLKKYKLHADGTVLSKDGESPAISESTGFFTISAEGYWNEDGKEPDGSDVTLGGMANLLSHATRSVYTETSAGASALVPLRGQGSTATFSVADTDKLDEIIDWAYGKNVIGNAGGERHSIGDPLHSEPVIVTYGGTDENPDSTIFFGTNEGFIHAVNTESGAEEFAFLPEALHSIQQDYFNNSIAASSKPYGMDGSITTWFKDVNNNNVILDSGTAEEGEHVYLYSGMRRGGRNYYGLNITNRNSPQLLFRIEGGTTTSLGDFSKLGQTWSRMEIAKVKFSGEDRFVLFFTGGYDTNQDSNTTAEADSIGNAVYMVDATSGELLWTASNSSANTNISEMVNSMPASPSLIDHNGDGFTDYLFAADMGGRVFRFDINQANTGAGNFAEGGVIASVSDNTVAGNRRFYNKPNISLVKDSQYGDFLTIGLGSGHRAHPKNTTLVENRFYVIKDRNPYSKPDSYIKITEANTDKLTLNADESASKEKLYNMTNVMIGGEDVLESNNGDQYKMLNNGGGWYVTLSSGGEKVLAESVTFSSAIIFTTFKPSSASSSSSSTSCGANTGEARMYALDLRTAAPVLNLDDDSDLEASSLLAHSGIAPRPVIIYREGGGKTIAVGTEAINDSRFESSDGSCPEGQTCEPEPEQCETNNCYVTPIYWRQNDQN